MKHKTLFKPHALVELWWTDSTAIHGWSKVSEIHPGQQSAFIHTIGFVVDDTEKEITITISHDLGPVFLYQCLHTVPWCSIKKAKRLRI